MSKWLHLLPHAILHPHDITNSNHSGATGISVMIQPVLVLPAQHLGSRSMTFPSHSCTVKYVLQEWYFPVADVGGRLSSVKLLLVLLVLLTFFKYNMKHIFWRDVGCLDLYSFNKKFLCSVYFHGYATMSTNIAEQNWRSVNLCRHNCWARLTDLHQSMLILG